MEICHKVEAILVKRAKWWRKEDGQMQREKEKKC